MLKYLILKKIWNLMGFWDTFMIMVQSNIHDNGTIKIESNSIFNNDPDCHPKNIVDYANENF